VREFAVLFNQFQVNRQILETYIGVHSRILIRVVLRPNVGVETGFFELLRIHELQELSKAEPTLATEAYDFLPVCHRDGDRPMLHIVREPQNMQKTTDSSRSWIADHLDNVFIATAIVEEFIALSAIPGRPF